MGTARSGTLQPKEGPLVSMAIGLNGRGIDVGGRNAGITLFRRGVLLLITSIAIQALLWSPPAGAAAVRLAYLDANPHRAVAQALKETFEASQLDVQLDLVPVSESQAMAMIFQWLATGEIADVFYLPVEWVGSLKGNRLLLPLDTLRWPGAPLVDLFGQFPPGIQIAFAEGRAPIGIPLTASASVFLYNERLLADAGLPNLDEFSREWNWYDLIDIGRRVAAPAQNRYMLDVDLEFTAVYFMVHGDVVTPDGMNSNILNEANVRILELAREAIYQHRISPAPPQQSGAQRRFSSQQLAMHKIGIENLHPSRLAQTQAQIPFGWNIALWPRSPFTGARPAFGFGAGLVVAWGARSLPDVSRLLDFAARPETQLAVAQRAGVIPAAPAALAGVWTGTSSAAAAAAQVLADWQFLTFPVVFVEDVESLLDPVQAVLNNTMEPQAALERVHLRFQEYLDSVYRNR